MPAIRNAGTSAGTANKKPLPGQFANQPLVSLTNQQPQFINANGSSVRYTPPTSIVTQTVRQVPTTAQIGATGAFGANLPISGSTGRTQSTGGGLNYTTNLPIAQTLRPIAQNVFNAFQNIGGTQGVGGRRPTPTQSYQVPVPITQQLIRANQPSGYQVSPQSPAQYTGANNAVGVNQSSYSQQPTPTPQLSRVNDRIVAIGGKKYFAPTLAGMISGSTMSQTNLVEPSAKSPYNDYASGYGYSSGYPYYGYDGSGYSGSSYDYQNSAFGNVLNWRLATG